jgi:hypothetical protein
MKEPGEPDAVNPHVRFDEGGLDGIAVQSSTLPIRSATAFRIAKPHSGEPARSTWEASDSFQTVRYTF